MQRTSKLSAMVVTVLFACTLQAQAGYFRTVASCRAGATDQPGLSRLAGPFVATSNVPSAKAEVPTVTGPWSRASASGFANVRPKFISVSAETKASVLDIEGGQGIVAEGVGSSGAESSHPLYFHTPLVPLGESVIIVYLFQVHGLLSGGASGTDDPRSNFECDVSLHLTIGGVDQIVADGQFASDPKSSHPLETGITAHAVSGINGQYFDFSMSASCNAYAAAWGRGSSAQANALFSNTFAWMGVQSVTDSHGNPIASYTFVDETGDDWSTPAPAPGTGTAALLGISLVMRRRRAGGTGGPLA